MRFVSARVKSSSFALLGLLAILPVTVNAAASGVWQPEGTSLTCVESGKVRLRFRTSPPSWEAEGLATKAFRSLVAAVSDDKKSAVVFEYSYNASTVTYFADGCSKTWSKVYPGLEGARQVKVFDGGRGVLFDLLTIDHHGMPDAKGNYLDEEAGDYKEGYIIYVSSGGEERFKHGPIWSYYSNIPLELSSNKRFGFTGNGREYLFFDLASGRLHLYEQPVTHSGGKVSVSDEGRVTVTRRVGRRRPDGSEIDAESIERAQRAGTTNYIKLLEGSTEIIEISHEYQF